MFFINIGKKFFRAAGYVVCVLLILLCIFLIICSAAFRSKDIVEVFGANVYIVQSEGYDKAPKGSAVLVRKTTAYDLSEGKLVLYQKGSDTNDCALGYVKNIYVVDGQYYLTVSDGDLSAEIAEKRLIGRADYSSVLLGSVLAFIKTPFGIFCVAVLPCIALIVYDIVRAAARNLPDPEVEPQFKNSDETGNLSKAVANRNAISVNSEGKADYSRNKPDKVSTGSEVLFNYNNRKAAATPQNRPIIPLTDKSPDKEVKAEKPAPAEKPKLNPAAIAPPKPARTPENIAVSRYISNAEGVSGTDTAEIAPIPKKEKKEQSDAFFAQTTTPSVSRDIRSANNAPQIGRQVSRRPKAAAPDEEENETSRPVKSVGKRSSQILASKRVEDLIGDDDDVRDKKRITNSVIDDIISGNKP